MTAVAVIPARGGSKRLPRKNIQELFGKPLLVWSINACQEARGIGAICVSSDDDEILQIAEACGAIAIERAGALADDETPKIEAIRHAYEWMEKQDPPPPEIIVSVQANSPEVRASDLDKAIAMLVDHGRWEVFSVDENNLMNGAFRVLRAEHLFDTFLSSHMGVIQTSYIDIHTQADLDQVQRKYSTPEGFIAWKES